MSQIDWIVAVILTVILVGLVLWSRRFAKDVSSFVVAGRKTRMWLGLSNNNAAGLGLVTIAYMAQEGFRHGFSTRLFEWRLVLGPYGKIGEIALSTAP